MTDQASNEALSRHFRQADVGDWQWFHPTFPGTTRLVDCSLEWSMEFWKLQDTGIRILTDFRVTTSESHVELLPSTLPWVLLESTIQKNWLLLLSAAHNNLDNTPRRAAAWVEEGHSFRGFQRRHAAHYRGVHRLHQADMNKNIRVDKERLAVRNLMLKDTGMKWAWNTDHLPAKGTTNWKAIIDYSVSNMECRGNTKVLTNTGFSDHNPIETTWQG